MAVLGLVLTFSPDSKRFIYGAGVKNEGFVVIDGKEEKHYDVIRIYSYF